MKWALEFTPDAEKQLRKLDPQTQRLIASWIKKHILGADDPRTTGKPLTQNLAGYWRYRIGNYRMICKIVDKKILVIVAQIGHRSVVNMIK